MHKLSLVVFFLAFFFFLNCGPFSSILGIIIFVKVLKKPLLMVYIYIMNCYYYCRLPNVTTLKICHKPINKIFIVVNWGVLIAQSVHGYYLISDEFFFCKILTHRMKGNSIIYKIYNVQIAIKFTSVCIPYFLPHVFQCSYLITLFFINLPVICQNIFFSFIFEYCRRN